MSDLTTRDETGIGRACSLFGVAGPNNDATILSVAALYRQRDALRKLLALYGHPAGERIPGPPNPPLFHNHQKHPGCPGCARPDRFDLDAAARALGWSPASASEPEPVAGEAPAEDA